MEDLWVLLVVGYLVVSFFGRAIRQARVEHQEGARARARAAARARAERLARAGAAPPAAGADHGSTATQVEARSLEELLRGLSGVLALPEEEPVATGEPAEAYSLEGTSLEEEGDAAPARRPTTADEEAEALVQRRIATAAQRSGALGPADHEAFHRRLASREAAAARPVPAAAPVRRTVAELRRAIVWREILGPPVSLREGDPS